MNKLPSTDLLHFGQRRGFGPHQDVIDIFSMTHKILQVKCTVTKLYPLSNFDYISANIGATNKLPSTDQLHFGQRRGFGPHWDAIDIFSMTH
jgi:hypothetical protein